MLLGISRLPGRSALHEAVTNYQANDAIGEGFIKCIQLLLDHGADAGLSVRVLSNTYSITTSA